MNKGRTTMEVIHSENPPQNTDTTEVNNVDFEKSITTPSEIALPYEQKHSGPKKGK